MKNFFFILSIALTLFSCTGMQEAGQVLRNEKIKNTDEFLVKKKTPLSMPPNYEVIPEPGSISEKKEKEEDKIKKILQAPKETDIGQNKSDSIEKSILDKIKK